ncbi:MAG: lysophospholipid acyltransferase family protein [Myxococcota bacterium]|nr:lysophospholipid acyltransferase family protein [Myxococcota bacterium]MEC9391507.1 lysophospholipid acyltransferase family protein [Myxococcota bacterium]
MAGTPQTLIRPEVMDGWLRLLAPVRRYHRHTVEGMDNIPRTGAAILVIHHTLATYDGFLFASCVYASTGRVPTALGDDLLFRTPWLKNIAWDTGIRPASPKAGADLLRSGQLMFVSPGGMWESLRPTEQSRTLRWDGRYGFCRLALRTQTPLVMVACPAADDIYTVKKSRITDGIYRRLRVPFPIARGVGPTPIPRPVKLTHHVSAPVQPPVHDPASEAQQVQALRSECESVMNALLHLP